MELDLADHQRLLQDSAARLCRDRPGSDPRAWPAIVQAGWLGLLASDADGGLGLGAVELGLIQVEIGRHDTAVPFAAVAIAAGAMGRVDGAGIVVPCIQGAGDAFSQHGPLPVAEREGVRLWLTGRHLATPGAAAADSLLVAAQADGGPILCLVRADVAGLVAATRATIDGRGITDLSFTRVAVDGVVADGEGAMQAIGRMHTLLAIAVSMELLGLGEAAMALLLSQLQAREQFGRKLGAFQALQHRAVDGFITLELLRSLAFRVAAAFDRGELHPAMVPALKAKAGRGVLDLVRFALQAHGAMGYTEEHAIGRHYKRALCLAAQYGGEAYQLERFAALTNEAA